MKRLIIAMLALCLIFGCSARSTSDTSTISDARAASTQVSETLDRSAKSVEKTAGEIKESAEQISKAPTTQAVKPFLVNIMAGVDSLFATSTELKTAYIANAQLSVKLDEAERQSIAKDKTIDAMEAKYSKLRESTRWLGWELQRWLWGISISLVVLAIGGFILNYYTDIFVIPVKWLVTAIWATIGGFFKAIGSIFSAVFKKTGKTE